MLDTRLLTEEQILHYQNRARSLHVEINNTEAMDHCTAREKQFKQQFKAATEEMSRLDPITLEWRTAKAEAAKAWDQLERVQSEPAFLKLQKLDEELPLVEEMERLGRAVNTSLARYRGPGHSFEDKQRRDEITEELETKLEELEQTKALLGRIEHEADETSFRQRRRGSG